MSRPPFKKPFKGPPPGGWRPRPFVAAPAAEKEGPPLIYGFHAVEAALANPDRQITRAFMTENAQAKLAARLVERGIEPERVTPRDLDKRLGSDTVHQGMLIEVEDLEELTLGQLARQSEGRPLLILDQVTDPHNVGAILRSAAVFGASGLIMTRRHSPPLAGALAKSASGALELVPIIRVQNLGRTMSELRIGGYRIAGLDGAAEASIETLKWAPLTAIVLGAEGKGMRESTGQACDRLVRISADGELGSLNVSNAAAVALFTASLARRGVLKPA